MYRGQIKRPKPTLQNAHSFHQDGMFSFDPNQHMVSAEERIAEGKKIDAELMRVLKQFPRTQNLEYAILKAHLIVEHAIVQYIRGFVEVHATEKDIGFSFAQRVKIAYLLGFGTRNPVILPTVEQLNKIRNQVAHSFELDRAAVDELLQINHEEYKDFKPKNDRERIKALRWICTFVSAYVSGNLSVRHIEAYEEIELRKRGKERT